MCPPKAPKIHIPEPLPIPVLEPPPEFQLQTNRATPRRAAVNAVRKGRRSLDGLARFALPPNPAQSPTPAAPRSVSFMT